MQTDGDYTKRVVETLRDHTLENDAHLPASLGVEETLVTQIEALSSPAGFVAGKKTITFVLRACDSVLRETKLFCPNKAVLAPADQDRSRRPDLGLRQ